MLHDLSQEPVSCFCLCVRCIASSLAQSVVSYPFLWGQRGLQHCGLRLTSNGPVSLPDCRGSFAVAHRLLDAVFQLLAWPAGASAGGMCGKPTQKGAGGSTFGVVESQARRACLPRGSTAGKAHLVVQGTDPVGLVSARVSRRKQQRAKTSRFFWKASSCLSLEITQPVFSSVALVC